MTRSEIIIDYMAKNLGCHDIEYQDDRKAYLDVWRGVEIGRGWAYIDDHYIEYPDDTVLQLRRGLLICAKIMEVINVNRGDQCQ